MAKEIVRLWSQKPEQIITLPEPEDRNPTQEDLENNFSLLSTSGNHMPDRSMTQQCGAMILMQVDGELEGKVCNYDEEVAMKLSAWFCKMSQYVRGLRRGSGSSTSPSQLVAYLKSLCVIKAIGKPRKSGSTESLPSSEALNVHQTSALSCDLTAGEEERDGGTWSVVERKTPLSYSDVVELMSEQSDDADDKFVSPAKAALATAVPQEKQLGGGDELPDDALPLDCFVQTAAGRSRAEAKAGIRKSPAANEQSLRRRPAAANEEPQQQQQQEQPQQQQQPPSAKQRPAAGRKRPAAAATLDAMAAEGQEASETEVPSGAEKKKKKEKPTKQTKQKKPAEDLLENGDSDLARKMAQISPHSMLLEPAKLMPEEVVVQGKDMPHWMLPVSRTESKSWKSIASCGSEMQTRVDCKMWYLLKGCQVDKLEKPHTYAWGKHGGPLASWDVARKRLCDCPLTVWAHGGGPAAG